MGKPYDHQYYFAGPAYNSAGTMICAHCHKPIDAQTQDWMHYTKPSKWDWAYVCFHRVCRPDDTPWRLLEERNAAAIARGKQLLAAAISFRDQWGVGDLDDLIDELS